MIEFKIGKDKCTVDFTEDDLLILNNSFNEICYGLEIRDFEKKIGTSEQEACSMLKTVHDAFKLLKAAKAEFERDKF